jgi:hypothetical protein
MIRESFQVGVVTLEEEKGEQPDRRGLALIIVQPNSLHSNPSFHNTHSSDFISLYSQLNH